MKNKKILLLITSIFLIVGSLLYMYDHVHYNRSKENIFEIPQTYNMWKSGDMMRYEKYYFIQSPPNSHQDLRNMIIDFINQNNVLEDAANNGADYVALSFMISDFNLPIFFEENKSYFNMDDRIKNYTKSNRIVLYTYNFKDDVENFKIDL